MGKTWRLWFPRSDPGNPPEDVTEGASLSINPPIPTNGRVFLLRSQLIACSVRTIRTRLAASIPKFSKAPGSRDSASNPASPAAPVGVVATPCCFNSAAASAAVSLSAPTKTDASARSTGQVVEDGVGQSSRLRLVAPLGSVRVSRLWRALSIRQETVAASTTAIRGLGERQLLK